MKGRKKIPAMPDMPKWDEQQKFFSRHFSGWWRDCCIAGTFLTRFPFPAVKGGDKKGALAVASRAFPVVGAAIGLISGIFLMAAAGLDLHPLACAFVALAVSALVTGALHEDGLADVADGFGSGKTAAESLKIMRDPRLGVFGVLAVVLSIGIRAGTLGGLPGPGVAIAALIAAHALSRGLLPAVLAIMTPARKSGLAHKAGTPDDESWATALVLGGLLAFLFLGPMGGLMAIIAAVAAVAVVVWLANRQVGGVTGDVLGAQQQMAEIAVLVAAAAAL
jgi:adenosylcobinamide-GDP ribazoletransferase